MSIQDGNASLDESSSWTDNHTNPKFFVLIAIRSLAFSICLLKGCVISVGQKQSQCVKCEKHDNFYWERTWSRGGCTAWICRYWQKGGESRQPAWISSWVPLSQVWLAGNTWWWHLASAGNLPHLLVVLGFRSRSRQDPEMGSQSHQSSCFESKTNQVIIYLLLKWCHLLDDRPQPSFEGDEPILGLARLVVEGGVTNQGCHVDIADSIQQQPTGGKVDID